MITFAPPPPTHTHTAICTLVAPWEAFVIGFIGVIIAVLSEMVVSRLKIDDPVGVIPVHAVCGIWGLLAVGTITDHRYLWRCCCWTNKQTKKKNNNTKTNEQPHKQRSKYTIKNKQYARDSTKQPVYVINK